MYSHEGRILLSGVPSLRLGSFVKQVSVFLLVLTLINLPSVVHAAPSPPLQETAVEPSGDIAYVRDAQELHLIRADGSQDHTIYSAPKVGDVQSTLRYPAWRPDGSEIAFTSDMEQAVSLLQSDIFAVKPDGNGLRKISDPPLNSKLNAFPTATVAVHVTNVDVGDSLFIIYITGAAQPQSVTVPAGTSKTVTFDKVAVFAGKVQIPVAIDGITRWFCASCTTTLQAGSANDVSIDIQGSGYDNMGVFRPVWRNDGAQVDYALGQACIAIAQAATPDPGVGWGGLLLGYSASPCLLVRGPTAALSNQVLYWDKLGAFPDGAFVKVEEGAKQANVVMDTGYLGFVYGMAWLPDGSGFLYSYSDGECLCSNIYAYTFGAQEPTQLTDFTDEYAAGLAVSPDGKYVVFERSTDDPNPVLNPDLKPDLWMMYVNGSNLKLFVKDGRDPAWGQAAQTTPTPPAKDVYLPEVVDRK